MHRTQFLLSYLLLATAYSSALPTDGTPDNPELNNAVEDLKLQCSNNDGIACIKFKFLNLLDQALKKDSFQVSETVSVVKNTDTVTESSAENEETKEETTGRGLLNNIEDYVKNHDIVFQLPQVIGGARLGISPRNLDNNELSLKLQLNDEGSTQVEGKGRKSRLRRLLVPLVIFILLKAITVIPLAIGVLGLKAWNALQLSFFSFVVSISLAIFQLCKKIAQDSAVPAAHTGAWEAYNQYAAARNFLEQAAGVADGPSEDPQFLVYNSHVPH